MHVKSLFPVAGIVAAGGVVLAVAAGALPIAASAESAVPHSPAAGTVRRDLLDTPTASGMEVLNAVQLQGDTFVIGRRDGDVRLAASIGGAAFDRDWESMNRGTSAPLKPDAIESNGAANTAGHVANLSGYVGSDVASVTVHPVAGGDVDASLHDGTVLAVWEGHDFASRDTVGTTLTIELRDGTRRTIPWTSLE